MEVLTTAEARSHIRERGGSLFVWATSSGRVARCATRFLRTSTEPPPDAFEWRRVETKGFIVFLSPGLRVPRELHLELRGRFQRRVEAFWEGCAFVM